MAFVASKGPATDKWRGFARMLYDLRCKVHPGFPGYINAFIRLLQISGYSKNGRLSRKGIDFAHQITKAVVESLPFPLQNPAVIENYEDYLSYRNHQIIQIIKSSDYEKASVETFA